MRKYKIIEVRDGNNNAHFEIWWHTPWFWNKDSWRPESSYRGAHIYITDKFETKEAAVHYINEHYAPKTRWVVEEGEA